ncbi:MAG TPA: hypothetical protein VF407_00370 [Polyangiaceae bacterium]
MIPRLALLFPILAAVSVLPACIPEHVGSQSNGSGGALQFQGRATSGAVATGFPVVVGIERFDPQYVRCVPTKNGSGCTSQHNEPIRLLDASCADDTCTVTPLPDDGSGIAKVAVTGAHAGLGTLHVDVKSVDDDSTWGDDYVVQFADPARLAITNHGYAQPNTRYASMPGASFWWCPTLVDSNGSPLAADSSIFANDASSDGAAITIQPNASYDEPSCVQFQANSPGKATLHFSAGSFSVAHDVTVADPSTITKAELRTYVEGTGKENDAGEIDSMAAEIADAPTTSITLEAESFEGQIFASVLTTSDGTVALGGGSRWVSSAQTIECSGYGASTVEEGEDLSIENMNVYSSANVIGDAEVTATFGSVTTTVPVHVVAKSADAGI